MITVILTIHVLIVLALIGIVLLQRSEGGALGMGGGGAGGGGFMTSRGAANALTRTTSFLAALFFATSISLAIFSERGETESDVIRGLTGQEVADPNAPITTDDLKNTLGADEEEAGDDTDLDLSGALGASGEAPAEDLTEDLTEDFAKDLNVEDALDALGADAGEEAPADPKPAAEDEPQQEPNR